VYYKEAVGAFVVFDLTRNSSFEAVKRWKEDIDAVRNLERCAICVPSTDLAFLTTESQAAEW